MEKLKNYIRGELVEPASAEYLDNVDPSTGETYSRVPHSDERDVERAVGAAHDAFPRWSHTSVAERSRLLLAVADLIDSNLDRLARAECVDNGKPLRLARSLDIPRAAANFRFFATAMAHFHSESHAMDDLAINYTLRQPRGIAGLISPWNLPLYLLTWKVAPALATGNTAVAKPSEVTPMTAFLLAELCQEAGLPPGVLNIVHGTGPRAGAALVRHPRVGTISFTGGTVTGAQIAATAAPLFKKVALEMGGKNPNIVFADTDLDQAVLETLRAAFTNQGQVCLCGSRIFVQRPVYEEFLAQLVAAARQLTVGDPLEETTDQGAIVSRAHYEKVLHYLHIAHEEGGNIRCGGCAAPPPNKRCAKGFFIQPTIITDLDVGCRVNQEEIFGPVASVTPFDTEAEVIAYANGVRYGLSASVWTRDVARAHRVASRLEAGTVWVNCWLLRDLRVPFGGMKQSGVGREGGLESLRFFTEPKNICIRTPDATGG